MGGVFRSQRHKTLFDGELTILEIFKPFSLTKIVIDRGITTSSSCILQSHNRLPVVRFPDTLFSLTDSSGYCYHGYPLRDNVLS